MELFKSFFSKDTIQGRTVRTLFQALIGIVTFVYGFLAIPGVQDYLVHNNLVSVGTLAVFVAAVTYAYNAVEKFVAWLRSTNSY